MFDLFLAGIAHERETIGQSLTLDSYQANTEMEAVVQG